MPHRFGYRGGRGKRHKDYKTPRGTHIAFGSKRTLKISFKRASRRAKRYMIIVSRKHVHVIRLKSMPLGSENRRRRRRKGRRRRSRRSSSRRRGGF